MKRALLLGGFGFLGSNILKYIDDNFCNEWSAIILDRVSSHPHGLQFDCVEKVYAGDFSDSTITQRIFSENQIDYVIHAISTTTPNSSQNAIYDIQSNLIPTLRLLDVMVQSGVKNIVFISSGGAIYGDNQTRSAFKESDNVFPKSSYGVTKLAIEKYLLQYASLYGLRPLILRLSNPYGKYHYSMKQGVCNVALRSAKEHVPFNVWGDGSSTKDYIYVEDFCAILFRLIDADVHTDVINVASGQLLSLHTILSYVEQYIPTFSYQHIESSKYDVTQVVLDNSKLLSIIGDFTFTTMDKALGNIVNWLNE